MCFGVIPIFYQMNLKLETEFSKTEILKEIDGLKEQLDELRPLPVRYRGQGNAKAAVRLELPFQCHRPEVYGETVAFLMEGITAKGKPLKDHLDIRGHNEAINFFTINSKEDQANIRS